jgi:hypothetical protein
MRSLALYNWISSDQPGANCEFAHGWWESAEFLQLLSSDFESFDFGVLTSYSMETPPPSSFVTMPVVSALAPNLEIYFKESWVVEPNYTVSVKWLLPGPLVLLDMLQPVDVQYRWLLRDFPTEYLYEPFREGVSRFLGIRQKSASFVRAISYPYYSGNRSGLTREMICGRSPRSNRSAIIK